MLIDFHTHGKLAKSYPFSKNYLRWLLREARLTGLDAICLTDHFLTLDFGPMLRFIADNALNAGDAYLYDGLKIFIGMETHIKEAGHILSIGTLEDILELNRRLEPHKDKQNLLPFSDLMDLFDSFPSVLVGAAHPFRDGSNIPLLPAEQLARLDFLDLNGKDLAFDRERTERLTYGMGERFNLPVVGGSDTHQANQYGCVVTEFSRDINTLQMLRRELKARRFAVHVSPQATQKVKAAGVLKSALKEIHHLGGDYAAVLSFDRPALQPERIGYNQEYGTPYSANL